MHYLYENNNVYDAYYHAIIVLQNLGGYSQTPNPNP
jgi:hypothetical protein